MPNRPVDDAPGRRLAPEGGHPAAPSGPPPDLAWELPHNFLGLDAESSEHGRARVLVLPVPYEATTSWGGGTRRGPYAILEASRYVELYDQELDWEPYTVGIHTLPALELSRAGPAAAIQELERAYGALLDAASGRFIVMLGGEHSISAAAVRVHAARASRRISVLQLDAHADLRPDYEGTPYSHASAMHRVIEAADLVAVGVRALTPAERVQAAGRDGVTLILADEMWEDDRWMERALDALGDNVYLTFDVDFLDPSLVPSTGTPEPGGGDWYRTLRFLRRVFEGRTVIGCDLVELAPIPGLRAPDFLVAKLVYKLIGYRFASTR
ncbi:MAG: agmatinase [Gemmatimonadetes bacterium]|nr:agmatinase [Gemmatimonadota bacterium]